mmetsp:Transcript_23499/g.32959  ORF Transcript_23499/g.32959 Transcript_23499/m.32959 type:complete len:334 (+) Transcript_23499:261-1262(+)
MVSSNWYSNLTKLCRPKEELSILPAIVYSFLVSLSFVMSLYVLVPKHIRDLSRDDPRQIKRRMIAVLTVCLVSTLVYPWLFCGDYDEIITASADDDGVSALQLMGWSFHNMMGPLLHSMLLYLGPIYTTSCRIYILRQRSRSSSFFHIVYTSIFQPILPSTVDEQWSGLRNLVVAPLTEEISFRGCIVPALVTAGMKSTRTTFVSPLFFGTAHFHHAILKLKEGSSSRKFVFFVTSVQFTYTSLFGSYAAHAFIRTNSIISVSLSHAFCNAMGLPDINLLIQPNPSSPMYPFRWSTRIFHIVGIILFVKAFSWEFLLPNKPALMEHIAPALSS